MADEPQTEKLIDDIFGDDEDDHEVNNSSALRGTVSAANDLDEGDIFGNSDSDDAEVTSRLKSGRLSKGRSKSSAVDSDDDYEEEAAATSIKIRRRGKGTKDSEKKSKSKRRVSGKSDGRASKRKRDSRVEYGGTGEDARDSGDEYDSGGELDETEQDQRFIVDEDDDEHAGIMKEYAQDNQNFDDDKDYYDRSRPHKKSANRKPSSSGGGSTAISARDTDPLSETLRTMKNPKAKGLTDPEKDIFVTKLQRKMDEAVLLDEIEYQNKRPAVHKLKILDAVQQAISLRSLHQTLLDKDILGNLRDWIRPRGTSVTAPLPALSVRTAVYDLLLLLPCQPEHLKRVTTTGKPPIGVVIVQLRKHKQETVENKKKLREIMDKWSRPIFSKNADVRMSAGGLAVLHEDSIEVRQAVVQRYAELGSSSGQQQLHDGNNRQSAHATSGGGIGAPATNVGFASIMSAGGASTSHTSNNRGSSSSSSESGADVDVVAEDGDGGDASNIDSAAGGGGGAGSKKAPGTAPVDPNVRVRTPYNQGFLFTVRPEMKQLDKRDQMERALGEGRMRLYKKTVSGAKSKALLGKKTNPRAVDMSVSGGGIKS